MGLLQSRPVGNLSCRWINTYSMGLWELQACMYSGDIHIQYMYLRCTHSCNSQRRRLLLDQCFPTVLASGLPTNGCLDPVQYQPLRTYINIFVSVWGGAVTLTVTLTVTAVPMVLGCFVTEVTHTIGTTYVWIKNYVNMMMHDPLTTIPQGLNIITTWLNPLRYLHFDLSPLLQNLGS